MNDIKRGNSIPRFRRRQKAVLLFIITSLFGAPALFSLPYGHMWPGDDAGSPYIGPVMGVSWTNDEPGSWIGVRAGWEFDRTVAIGLTGNWMMTRLPQEDGNDADYGYGGVEFRTFIAGADPVSVAFDITIGAGTVGSGAHVMGHYDNDGESDGFLVVEPELHAIFRVNEYVRIELGAGYLFTNGADLAGLSDSDLSGPKTTLAMSFGRW
ncbi:MAG: hypothetical protein WD492_02845 [Alkalispirochaeta sp.]